MTVNEFNLFREMLKDVSSGKMYIIPAPGESHIQSLQYEELCRRLFLEENKIISI